MLTSINVVSAMEMNTIDASDLTKCSSTLYVDDDANAATSDGPKTNIDLTVTSVYFTPVYPASGEDIELKIKFKNLGIEDCAGHRF